MVERAFLEQFTGATLGNYRLEQLIEQSKWGPVFLASSRTGTPYTIRFVGAHIQEKELDTDAHIVFLGRFQQEANQVAALSHPHILPLLDYGNYRGRPYLVYPHIPLTSLRSLLAQSAAPTDLKSVGRYLDQTASALEYAHEHAVIHRNLSTACIYIQANRQLTVGEFGLIRIYELSRQDSSQTGKIFNGSSESSSPEQLLGRPIDAYADTYALGAVLYRLLTGHPPFSGKTREEVTRQHLYAEVPSLKLWRQGLPVDLDHIIIKAMAKEPMRRYRQPIIFAQSYHQIVAPYEPYSPLIASQPVTPVQVQSFAQTSASLRPVKVERNWMRLSRRRIVALLAISVGVVATGSMAIAGAEFLKGRSLSGGVGAPNANKTVPVAPPSMKNVARGNGTTLIQSAEVPVNSAKTFPIANQSNPGVLIHLPNNRFVAFDTTCTHASCSVNYDPQDSLLKCPCHGAIFDPAKNAEVVQGPAQTPLAPIKITVNADGTITA
ncbi:MAG: protein kinase [Ktedonobacteraceae bacterium]|nr:protein kinase [Ktedonobacteraceae bacterium]